MGRWWTALEETVRSDRSEHGGMIARAGARRPYTPTVGRG
jgi:hypothetical protein